MYVLINERRPRGTLVGRSGADSSLGADTYVARRPGSDVEMGARTTPSGKDPTGGGGA